MRTYDALCCLTARVLDLIKIGGMVADDVSRPLWEAINACKRDIEAAGYSVGVRCYMRDASEGMGNVYTFTSVPDLQQMNLALTYGALCGATGAVGELMNAQGEAQKGGEQ